MSHRASSPRVPGQATLHLLLLRDRRSVRSRMRAVLTAQLPLPQRGCEGPVQSAGRRVRPRRMAMTVAPDDVAVMTCKAPHALAVQLSKGPQTVRVYDPPATDGRASIAGVHRSRVAQHRSDGTGRLAVSATRRPAERDNMAVRRSSSWRRVSSKSISQHRRRAVAGRPSTPVRRRDVAQSRPPSRELRPHEHPS